MHLLESYSLSSGLKISNPFLYEKFFPTGDCDYILISNGGGNNNFPAKLYDYWQIVVDLIKPKLEEHNIKIIQIGLDNEIPLNAHLDFRGKTSFHNINYLIRNCLLYVGNDSVGVHIAGWHNKKIVALYGSTSIANHGPFFGNKDNQILIESPKNGRKISFSAVENPKTINRIKPEDVANSIFKLLNINYNCSISTVHLGEYYNNASIETVPNHVVTPNFFNGVLNVRGDLCFNEKHICQQLELCKCALVISQPINLNILKQFKQNIALIVFKIDKFFNLVDYIKKVQNIGLPFSLITDMVNKDEINNRKIDLYEYGTILPQKRKTKKDIEFLSDLSYNHLKIKTQSFILSEGKVYVSEVHLMQGKNCESISNTESEWIDHEDVYKNIEKYWIYTNV